MQGRDHRETGEEVKQFTMGWSASDYTAFLVLCFATVMIPLALALRAWPRDRVRLGVTRQGLGWRALALTTGTSALCLVCVLRLAVATQRVRLEFLLNDWAFTVARIGFWLATITIATNAGSIGRTRVYGLFAAGVALWIYAGMFTSV